MQRLTHVIEIFDGEVTSIRTFAPDAIMDAHNLFKKIIRKKYTTSDISDNKIEEILETDKIFYSELYRVQIVTGIWGV